MIFLPLVGCTQPKVMASSPHFPYKTEYESSKIENNRLKAQVSTSKNKIAKLNEIYNRVEAKIKGLEKEILEL